MRARFHILPGRHQPPHNDHLAIIRRALSAFDGELFLALITDVPRPWPEVAELSELEREARAQHGAERTPFTFAERLHLVNAMLESLDAPARRRVRVIPLPRPESDWAYACAIFPGERTWIVPDAGEPFDELKVRFFREKGDAVLRVHVRPTTDGRRVRELWELGDLRLHEHVPPRVFTKLCALREERKGAGIE